ncbi:MAG: RNA polymerase sigma factor [Bacteroidota bacterium]
MDSPISDQDIIKKVLSGDTDQYNELVLRHKNYAYSLALKIVHNPMDAEEVAHDAFIKAYRSLKSYRQTAKFTTWLYRIVFNTAVSHTRKNTIHVDDISNLAKQPESSYTSNADLFNQDRARFIKEAIEKLPPLDASLITLFYMKQLNLEEIGEVVNLNSNAVKVKLFRARQKLAREIKILLHEEVYEIL